MKKFFLDTLKEALVLTVALLVIGFGLTVAVIVYLLLR